MLLENKYKVDKKMVNYLKKHYVVLMIIFVPIIIAVIMLLYLSMNKKGKEDYIEIFNENQNIFVQISSSLMPLGYEMSIVKESEKIVVIQNENASEISQYPLDEEIKNNIERVMRDVGIRSINKSNTYLEFVFDTNKDLHSISYAEDKNQLISYT